VAGPERKITTVVASDETSAAWLALTLHQQTSTKGVNPQGFINAIDRVIARSLWKEKAATLSEFLAAPYPEGAGISPELLEQTLKLPFIHQLKEVEQEVEDARLRILEALASPDGRASNGRHLKEWDRNRSGAAVKPDLPQSPATPAKDRSDRSDRASAIARAPRIARELHLKKCLGTNEAVKLGPRLNSKPTAQQLALKARVDKVAASLEGWVNANPIPTAGKDRPAYKRQINAMVRGCLDEPAVVAAVWRADATTDEIVAAFRRKVPAGAWPDVLRLLAEQG
jgi:hypothetical protein